MTGFEVEVQGPPVQANAGFSTSEPEVKDPDDNFFEMETEIQVVGRLEIFF